MLNDRKDEYQGSDDSEYHFSDDEVHYEVDSEAAKQNSAASSGGGLSGGGMSKSRRMMIAVVVFLALVFVVYKMVSPTASTPDISNITPQQAAPPVAAAPPQQQAPTTAFVSPQNAQPAAQTSALPQMQQPVTQQQGAAETQQMPPQVPSQQMQPPQQVVQMQQPNQQPVIQQQIQPPTAVMPQEVAGQQAYTQQPMPNNSYQVSNVPSSVNLPDSSPAAKTYIDSSTAQIAAENARLSGQLQAEYVQRLNDYQTQNKNLQDQVQILNSRVASMESEMSQLIQTLTQQLQGGAPVAGAVGVEPPKPVTEQTAPLPRIPYSVQAIIPGRAWLRANNGDTLTVAEGESIKGIGRVTKIDPYDGVVEINVQGRAVTLSYGDKN